MTKAAPAVCAMVGAIFVASCGGGDDSSSSTSASSGPAASARPAFQCLSGDGLDVQSTPPNSPSVVSAITVDSGQPTQVIVWFMKSPGAADKYVKGAASYLSNAGGNATAEVFAKEIVVGLGPKTTDASVKRVENCLTS